MFRTWHLVVDTGKLNFSGRVFKIQGNLASAFKTDSANLFNGKIECGCAFDKEKMRSNVCGLKGATSLLKGLIG